MQCVEVIEALSRSLTCAETDEGTRIATHCLYPSFDQVHVFVAKIGEGFKVHDGGGAARAGWDLGRDDRGTRTVLSHHAKISQLALVGDALVAEAVNRDWLVNAILAVANASAAAATSIAERAVAAAEDRLRERVEAALLSTIVEEGRLAHAYEVVGKSGKRHAFDFAVRSRTGAWVLVGAVTPYPASISARYVAFADTRQDDETLAGRFAVYERNLQNEDAALMLQVADLVSLGSLPAGIRREMLQ